MSNGNELGSRALAYRKMAEAARDAETHRLLLDLASEYEQHAQESEPSGEPAAPPAAPVNRPSAS
jgi:rubrerythrin